MVERQFSKLHTRVRFSPPAPLAREQRVLANLPENYFPTLRDLAGGCVVTTKDSPNLNLKTEVAARERREHKKGRADSAKRITSAISEPTTPFLPSLRSLCSLWQFYFGIRAEHTDDLQCFFRVVRVVRGSKELFRLHAVLNACLYLDMSRFLVVNRAHFALLTTWNSSFSEIKNLRHFWQLELSRAKSAPIHKPSSASPPAARWKRCIATWPKCTATRS